MTFCDTSKLVAVTIDQVRAFRMARQHLRPTTDATPAEICSALGGIQAQVQSAAELSLKIRNHNLDFDQIQDSLWKEKSVIKTSSHRGTLHLLAVSDFPFIIQAIKQSRMKEIRRYTAKMGVAEEEIDGLNQAVMKALESGPLLRQELTAAVRPAVSEAMARWMEYMWSPYKPALAEGLICYGPNQGNEVTLVRLDHWCPGLSFPPEEDAKVLLARNYLRAFGPAIPRDLAKWTGWSVAETRSVWQDLIQDLLPVQVDDQELFILKEDADTLSNSGFEENHIRLLPTFDVYLLGHADKSWLVDEARYKQVYRAGGWISPVILLNGRVAGTWSYKQQRGELSVRMHPFRRFSRAMQREIEVQATYLANFLNRPLQLSFGPIS